MVEWKKIDEVCRTVTPPKKMDKELYGGSGAYPIIDQGQKNIVGYTDEKRSLVPNEEYFLLGNHARNVNFFESSFTQGTVISAKETIRILS